MLSGGEDVLFALCNTVQHQLASRGRPGKHFKLLNPFHLGTCELVELGHHGLLAASRGIIQLRVNGVVRVHGLGSKYQKRCNLTRSARAHVPACAEGRARQRAARWPSRG